MCAKSRSPLRRSAYFKLLSIPNRSCSGGAGGECQIESFSLDPRRGGRWAYDTKQTSIVVNDVSKFHLDGEVLEFEPPRLLAYTWISNAHEDKTVRTVVRWELTPEGKGTRLKVTTADSPQLPVSRKSYAGGWPGVVGNLKNFVEQP